MTPPAPGSGGALTPRDFDILWSLHQARYLTIDAIEWLHFPQWRERYVTWQAVATGKRYLVCNQAYSRLQTLTTAKLVHRITRPVMLAVDRYQREADLFTLTKAGAELVAVQRGLELHEIHHGSPRTRSYASLPHHAAVGRVYAALRTRIEEKPGLSFTQWHSEHDFKRDYDRLTVWLPHAANEGELVELGIQPDGGFFIEHPRGRTLCFVEVERDQPLTKWRKKIWAYEAYRENEALRARFDCSTFILLGIGQDEAHQQKLLQATGEALALLYANSTTRQAAQERYLIGQMGQVHPTTIGFGWKELTAVMAVERGGAVPWSVTVETVDYTFIT